MTAEILPWAGHQLTLADWEAMPEDERFRLELVEGLCDRVAVIAGGRVLAEDTTAGITRGGSLHQRFLELVGATDSAGEGLTWLG